MKKYLGLAISMLMAATAPAQDYKKIHADAIVVDTHNDVLGAAVMKGLLLENDLRGKTHTDFARLKAGGVDVQVFAVFCDEKFGKDTAFKFANIEIDSLYAIAARNRDKMLLVKTPAELMHAVNAGKLAAMIGVEGGHMIEDNLQFLDSLYKRGARYLTLTWNNSTAWASSAHDEYDSKYTGHKGLSAFGQQVVKRMNALGMMIDVSHVGPQTVADVLKLTTKPIIASHSSAYALNPVYRNLTDEQARAIAKNGGVIQVNFYDGFLDSNWHGKIKAFETSHQREVDSLKAIDAPGSTSALYFKRRYPNEVKQLLPPMSILLDHIDHMVKVAGIDHVGLGSDYDGIDFAPAGLEDVTSYPTITEALLKRGYSKEDVTKILGGNFLRVFKANSN